MTGVWDVVDSRMKSDITLAGSLSTSANRHTLSSSSASRHHYTRLVVFLPTFWFRLAWLGLLTLQVAVAVAILHYGYLLHYFASEGMTYYANLLRLMPPNALTRVANCMLALSGWHVLMAARTVWASIRARRLVFVSLTPVGVQMKDPSLDAMPSSASSTRRLTARCEQSFLHVYRWIWYELLGRRGVFGVESPLFDVLFVLRELIEIGSQTYQTYRLAHLVASPWIINISTLLVIVNCVSTPVVRHFLHGKPAVERTVCLAVDALLDVSTSLGIPLIIFWPYYRAFIPEIISFADELLFDDVWQIRALMENKQIYMTSEVDCVSKLVPLVSMISSFNGIRKLIQEQSPVSAIKPLTLSGKGSSRRLATAQERRRSMLESFWEDRVASVITVRTKSRVNRFVHTLLLLWAIAVGVIHLVAVKTSFGTGEEFGCKLSTQPWFSTRFSCAVLEINCNRQKELFGGVAIELGRIMETLEDGSLGSLIISHCPQLSVPPQLQHFSSLLSMEVYNSTIVAWPRASALTQQHHPAIGLLTLVRCNMSELPEGVLADHPRALTDITIVASNLTTLPQDLDVRWLGVSSLLIEQGQFKELPATVARMASLIRLSFVGNEIATIADDVFIDSMQLYVLALSGNPLTTVPVYVGSVVNFKTLYLDHTRVTQLPKWAITEAFLEAVLWVAVDQTPYCSDRAKVGATDASSAHVQELLALKVRCSPEKGRVDGFFPLAQAARKRVP
ncbi:hypothetical protein Gpo141_00001558 [Globisporangium polare]